MGEVLAQVDILTEVQVTKVHCPKVRGWGYNQVITLLAPKRVIGKVGRVI